MSLSIFDHQKLSLVPNFMVLDEGAMLSLIPSSSLGLQNRVYRNLVSLSVHVLRPFQVSSLPTYPPSTAGGNRCVAGSNFFIVIDFATAH